MWAKYIFVPLPDAGIRVYKRGPARDQKKCVNCPCPNTRNMCRRGVFSWYQQVLFDTRLTRHISLSSLICTQVITKFIFTTKNKMLCGIPLYSTNYQQVPTKNPHGNPAFPPYLVKTNNCFASSRSQNSCNPSLPMHIHWLIPIRETPKRVTMANVKMQSMTSAIYPEHNCRILSRRSLFS